MVETIGYCESCGRVDHHLVAGLCPVCQARWATFGVSERAHARDGSAPNHLGAEADVSHLGAELLRRLALANAALDEVSP